MLKMKFLITITISVIAVLYYQYINPTTSTQFKYNLNFDLLNRTIPTLDQHNRNSQINHEAFAQISDLSLLNVTFQHGVASGDPLTDRVILWTRLTPSVDVDQYELIPLTYKVVNEFENETISSGWTCTSKLIDYTVKIDVTSLEPNQTYHYQFTYDNKIQSIKGETRTLPKEDQLSAISIAVYSCSNYAGGYYHAYKFPVLKDSIDYVVHLGDYIYEYSREEYVDGTEYGRAHEPAHECYTLDDYRIRYGSYRLDQDLQASHAKYPWILVWDDHEVTDNSYHSGSVHSRGYEFITRKDVATQAYFEWLPIRPQANLNKIWRNFQFGKLFNLNMLDTRHYDRDLTDIYDNQDLIKALKEYEYRSILGYDQEKWLELQLLRNKTIWNFISSQCVVNSLNFTMPETGGIGWPFEEYNQDSRDGYIANRNRLLNFIEENKLNNTVILSGDFHIAIASELHTNKTDYDLKTGEGSIVVEFTASAVSSPSTFPRGLSYEQCLPLSEELVTDNSLVWNEGYWRGYYELTVDELELNVKYYGVDVKKIHVEEEHLLAEFKIKKDDNKIDRKSIDVHQGFLNKAIVK